MIPARIAPVIVRHTLGELDFSVEGDLDMGKGSHRITAAESFHYIDALPPLKKGGFSATGVEGRSANP